MNLVLNIYTDDTLTELKRTAEADRLKIPYRVALTVVKSLDGLEIDSERDVLELISKNADLVDKIVKATFGISDSELECTDVMEMGQVAIEVYKWGLGKINSLKGGQEKNEEMTA